ncbi:MAG: iron hydrogenase small subunit [Limnochordaceae bacterium]|nr:iron hydrogenase small subunit [Limnochordaceae bacterium]
MGGTGVNGATPGANAGKQLPVQEQTVTIRVNGQPVQARAGANLLEVLKNNGFGVPSLCYLEKLPAIGACRLCLVEIKGVPKLQTSCTTTVNEGMEILTHSPRVREARRTVLQLLLADHPNDCLFCVRSGDCELQALAQEYGVQDRLFGEPLRHYEKDLSTPSLQYDPNKCVLCERCVRTCTEVQTVNAIGLVRRGIKMRVAPPFETDWAECGCTYCGQCAKACPTGALTEKDDTDRLWAALADPDKVVVAQIAPAVRVTVGERWATQRRLGPADIPADFSERIVAALKAAGVRAVFDTQFSADLTIMEETHEFVERLKQGKRLPIFTSCCPAWVRFVELYFPQLTEHLSSCKSPQGMMGALLKSYYARKVGVDPAAITVVSIMPCTAKKFEATRPELGQNGRPDVDIVLTTRELIRFMEQAGIDPGRLAPQPFDDPLGESTGAAAIFGASGGVAEAALRTAHYLVTGEDPKYMEFKQVRGWDNLRSAELQLNGTTVKCAVVSSLGGARRLLESGQFQEYDFVEVMACPGGCVNGGGQLRQAGSDRVALRAAGLYVIDEKKRERASHHNPAIAAVYSEFLGEPGSPVAHRLLHTHYSPQDVDTILAGTGAAATREE